MAQQTIGIGSVANDGTGDTIRDAFDKANDNFTELYAGLTGLLDFKGSTDCSANPNYPAASKGDFYLVSVAGKIGGASGTVIEAGDSYFATADNPDRLLGRDRRQSPPERPRSRSGCPTPSRLRTFGLR
jgi:hypothetical protein